MVRSPSTLWVLVLALIALACAPGWLLASTDGKEEANILSPRFDLTIWTIVIFVLLYLVLRYVKLPGASAPAFVMMLEGLRNREQSIQNDLAEAERARQEAQKLREQFQAEIDRAQDKVREILDGARKDAQQLRDTMQAQTKADIQAERDRSRREISGEKDKALKELWDQTAQLATLVAAKAIRRQLTTDDHQRLVDEALADLRKAGEGRIG